MCRYVSSSIYLPLRNDIKCKKNNFRDRSKINNGFKRTPEQIIRVKKTWGTPKPRVHEQDEQPKFYFLPFLINNTLTQTLCIVCRYCICFYLLYVSKKTLLSATFRNYLPAGNYAVSWTIVCSYWTLICCN